MWWLAILGLIFFGFIIPLLISLYSLLAILADLKGAPFVPTDAGMVGKILERAKLKKGQAFLELGSGDGRVVRMAVKKYGVKGVGVEVNPLLVWYSKLISHLKHLEGVKFKKGNFFNTDLSKADVIFLFLLPKTLEKLRQKLLNQSKKGTLIISHGFKIEGMDKNLVGKIERKLFPTYYYKI